MKSIHVLDKTPIFFGVDFEKMVTLIEDLNIHVNICVTQ